MGGGEAALDGDVGNGVLLLSEHIASRLYSDDVKIGDEGYANVLWKHVAEVVSGYAEPIRNVLYAQGSVIVFVDVFYYQIHSFIGLAGVSVVIIISGMNEIKYLEKKLCYKQLVGTLVGYLTFVVFSEQVKKQVFKLLSLLCVGGEDKGLVAGELVG